MSKRPCKSCGIVKPLDQYAPASACRDGHRLVCKACMNERQKVWAKRPDVSLATKAYRSDPAFRERENTRRRSPKGRESYKRRADATPSFCLSFARSRALKRRPTENPVTHAELVQMFKDQRGRCAVSGIGMVWHKGALFPESLTIDRIDNERGYSRDNVRLVCHAVNLFKGQMTDARMLIFARAIVNKAEGDAQAVCRDGLQDFYAPLAKWQWASL